MSDSKSLALLVDFVQNPLVLTNFTLHKYMKKEFDSIAEHDDEVAGWMGDLAHTVEEALSHLAEHGIPAARLATAYFNGSEKVN